MLKSKPDLDLISDSDFDKMLLNSSSVKLYATEQGKPIISEDTMALSAVRETAAYGSHTPPPRPSLFKHAHMHTVMHAITQVLGVLWQDMLFRRRAECSFRWEGGDAVNLETDRMV